jgi:hypothetical protein
MAHLAGRIGYFSVMPMQANARRSGVELISKVVAANIRLPVIMATGALPIHEFKRHPWLNNIAVLEKPISNSALLSIVEKVLVSISSRIHTLSLAARFTGASGFCTSRTQQRIPIILCSMMGTWGAGPTVGGSAINSHSAVFSYTRPKWFAKGSMRS